MRVRLLGRPAITGDGAPVELRGPRQAGLLALLGAEVGRVVRTSRIEDELWDGHRVSESAVRVTVNRLRARFLTVAGTDPIVSHTLGYALDLAPHEVDLHRFVAEARVATTLRSQGRSARALEQADRADRWWRGPAFEGVAELTSVRPEVERLETLRCDLWQERAGALIELARFDDAIDQLELLLAASPYRESAWGLRLYALARAGRRDEAVARYRQLAELLDHELAIAPGADITVLAEAIRAGDPDPEIGRTLLAPARRPDEAARPNPTRHATSRSRRDDGPFVGRAALLDEITATALGEDGAAIVVVDGPPGIGKTRLAAEVANRVTAAGGTSLIGSCPREGSSSVATVADIVADALAQVPVGDDRGLDALAALVPAAFGATPPAADPDPAIRRLQLFDAATQVLARLDRRPVLVVVDDIQWVSTDGARFLHHLIERSDARWLLLAREGERSPAAVELLADIARWRPVWRRLSPLGAPDVADLVRRIAPLADASVAQTVADRAGGNPFFVTELVRHLTSGGQDAEVPPGITQLVHAGLGRLEPSAARVAEVLAVAGDPLPFSALPAACSLDSQEVDGALADLGAAGLVTRSASAASARLAHDLVAETVGAAIGPGRRRDLHTAIGRALTRAAPRYGPSALRNLLEGQSELDAEELDEAAAAALRHLNEGSAHHEAIRVGTEYLERTVGDRPTCAGLAARVQLASALLTAGSYGRGTSLLDQIDPDIRRQGDAALSAEAIIARGTANVADPGLAVRVDQARLVLDALDPTPAARRIQLACWIAHHLALLGRSREALEVLDRAERDNRFDLDPTMQAMILGIRLQVAAGVETSPATARAAFAELRSFVDDHPAVRTEAWWRLFALDQAVRDGTLDDHDAAIDALAELVIRFPQPDVRWTVQAAKAGHALARGELDLAEELIVAAQVTGGELSVGSAAAVWITQLFMLQYERGDLAVMTPFLSSLAENASPYQLAARALLHIESGDAARARVMAARLGDVPALLAGAGAGWSAIPAQVGDIAFFADERRLAETIIGELGHHAGTALSAHGLLHLGAADRTLGLAWATLGELDRAIDLLDQAHAADRRRGALRWSGRAARSGAALRRTRRRRGDIEAARMLDREAGWLLAQ